MLSDQFHEGGEKGEKNSQVICTSVFQCSLWSRCKLSSQGLRPHSWSTLLERPLEPLVQHHVYSSVGNHPMERQIKGLEKTNDKCQCLSRFEDVLRLILKRYREKLINSIKSWTLPADSCSWNSPVAYWIGFVHIQSLQSWRRVGDNRHIPLK